MSFTGFCLFCKRPVDSRHAAYRVTGWELARSGGGANRILGRERVPDLVAHSLCAEKHVKHGEQEELAL